MEFRECFEYIASRQTDELVVTSAGYSSRMWRDITGDTERVFYVEASMSLSTMFAAGLAHGLPEVRVWAFMGDGAFAMNPGALMVERYLDLPNLTHILVSNRIYGSTFELPLPLSDHTDYVAVAKGFGIARKNGGIRRPGDEQHGWSAAPGEADRLGGCQIARHAKCRH